MDETTLAALHSQLIARKAELEALGQATMDDVQPVELDQACAGDPSSTRCIGCVDA